jgi:hypothetical protein
VPWPGTKYIIRGKVVTSPKSGPWWVLWVRVCSWFVRAPKCSNYTQTNLLFGLCKSMWVIELLVNLPSPHPRAPTCPFSLELLWVREHAPILSPSIVFTFGLIVESIKELGGASVVVPLFWKKNSLLFKSCHFNFFLLQPTTTIPWPSLNCLRNSNSIFKNHSHYLNKVRLVHHLPQHLLLFCLMIAHLLSRVI